jgi:hypothetical protein
MVIGCGGVGMASIAGSALARAGNIIAVDIDDRKLEWARHGRDGHGELPGAGPGGGDPGADRWLRGRCGDRRDHVRMAPELRERVEAPILLHPADRPLWELTHRDELWDADLADGQEVQVGGATLRVLHTPGHAPGAVCLHLPEKGCVFTGDTLFSGGPGATGRSFSDADQIRQSIRSVLFALPDETVVHTGHGEDTTIGAERSRI